MSQSQPMTVDKLKLSAIKAKNPLLFYCVETYQAGYEKDSAYFQRIKGWNDFADEIIFNTENARLGSQVVMPQLRKLYEGMIIPEGRLETNAMVEEDSAVHGEQFVGSEFERQNINKLFIHHRAKCKKDGCMFWVGKIDEETGEMYSDFVRRRNITFDENAETINEIGSLRPAQWKFEVGRNDVATFMSTWKTKLEVKYGKKETELILNKVQAGYPSDCKEVDDNMSTTQLGENNDSDSVIGILDVMCKAAPIDFEVTVGTTKYKIPKGEPFHVKLAGGSGEVICIYTGKEFVHRWAHKKTKRHPLGEPYFPCELLVDTQFGKGLQYVGYWAIAQPFLEKIMHYEDLLHKYVNLVADPDFVLNFKRSNGSQAGTDDNDAIDTTKNWVALNLRKKLEGKKTSNFILTGSEEGVDVDIKSATPQNLNLGQVEAIIDRLKRDLSDTVQILHNDTSYDENAKVGILRYKEEEQSGAVAAWQRHNEPQIANINKIILNSFLTLFPTFNKREITITDSGIDGFVYRKPLSELKETISPEVLSLKWKFAFTRPTGAVQAAAEAQSIQQMLEIYREFGVPIPTIEKALFESQAKLISLDKGTSPFNAEEAFNDLQRARGQAAAAEGGQGDPNAQVGADQNIGNAGEEEIANLLGAGVV